MVNRWNSQAVTTGFSGEHDPKFKFPMQRQCVQQRGRWRGNLCKGPLILLSAESGWPVPWWPPAVFLSPLPPAASSPPPSSSPPASPPAVHTGISPCSNHPKKIVSMLVQNVSGSTIPLVWIRTAQTGMFTLVFQNQFKAPEAQIILMLKIYLFSAHNIHSSAHNAYRSNLTLSQTHCRQWRSKHERKNKNFFFLKIWYGFHYISRSIKGNWGVYMGRHHWLWDFGTAIHPRDQAGSSSSPIQPWDQATSSRCFLETLPL